MFLLVCSSVQSYYLSNPSSPNFPRPNCVTLS
nr:MAG TPA: hypothetical protein [Caudoviricetes sp.]